MKTPFVTLLLVLLCTGFVSACSKTISWEEQIPLNTGEVIWVKRSAIWEYSGGHGNPFDVALRPTGEQTIRFEYAGSQFDFTGRIKVGWLAISPNRKPVLVAIPSSSGWNYQSENSYYCVVPYYVQFVPDETGYKWTWPEKIEHWIYRLPANIMINTPSYNESIKDRYSIADREQRDALYMQQSPYAAKIDPDYDGGGECPKKQLAN